MDNEILKIYNSIVSKYKFDDEIKKEKSIDEILNNNKTKAIWYISAIQCIEEKITKNFSEEETKKILYWILENKIKYSEGIFNSVFQIKFISQFYVLTINLLQSYTSRNIPIDEKDILMKECSNNIISITSLPVLFSNIEGLYENYSERLLKTLESSNMKTCNELQKCFISDVYTAPLMPLPNIANERVDSKLKDQKLSQSIYIVLLSFLEDMVRFYRIHSLDYDENQKIALCDKIESIVKFICGKIKKTSPSRTLCEKGLQIINNFEEIDINNKEQMKDASLLLEEILKEKLEKDKNMEYATPDYCFRIPNVSPITKLLSSKLMQMNNDDIDRINKEENTKEKTFEELRRTRINKEGNNNNNLVCYIEQVWVQVELETNSVVLTDVTYPDLSNYFCSSEFGVFKMNLKYISWYGKKNLSINDKYDEAIRILYSEIDCYSYGFINNNENNENDVKNQYAYIIIYLKQEVFKFYPFKIHELQLLLTALYSLTGIIPVRQEQQVKAILMKKIENVRREVLLYLIKQESPWITTSDELNKVLSNLTHEKKPQRILEIERVFHSCRLESEVTKETIYFIRKRWHETFSERVRVKILIILDRLIDRTVLTQSDPNFSMILKWLEYLEENSHPIKNFEVLNLIEMLIKRAKMIRIKTLTPISINSLTTSFDNYDDFIANLLYTEKIKEI